MTRQTARGPGSGAGVHQVLATLGYGDAIGHEVMGIRRALRAHGFASDVFVETADLRLKHETRDYREMLEAIAPEDVLIHHYSIGSRASRLAYALPNRMALIYHNITPPEYFLGVHPPLVQLCFAGRRELAAYVSRVEIALGDSVFNRLELESMGFPVTGVLPVVPGFSHLDVTPNRFVAGEFDDDWTNILFVGRVIPNKRFEDLIRVFHAYRRRHDAKARLLLVGSHAGFEKYLASLQFLARRLRVRDVHFVGHVSNEELAAYYDVADVFLCASAHEGFCVPLVEAFYKGVPVVAYAAAAVPATLDGAGVLYDDRDPAHVAALVHEAVANEEYRRRVIEAQDAAVERLRRRDFGRLLIGFVEQVMNAPLRPQVPVPDAFWHEVRTVELRKHRPALNMAQLGGDAGGR